MNTLKINERAATQLIGSQKASELLQVGETIVCTDLLGFGAYMECDAYLVDQNGTITRKFEWDKNTTQFGRLTYLRSIGSFAMHRLPDSADNNYYSISSGKSEIINILETFIDLCDRYGN